MPEDGSDAVSSAERGTVAKFASCLAASFSAKNSLSSVASNRGSRLIVLALNLYTGDVSKTCYNASFVDMFPKFDGHVPDP